MLFCLMHLKTVVLSFCADEVIKKLTTHGTRFLPAKLATILARSRKKKITFIKVGRELLLDKNVSAEAFL